MSRETGNPYGCFDRRFLIELIPTFVAMVGAVVLAYTIPRTPAVRLALSGIVSVALAYSIVVTVAAIRRLDELQQRIHLIAIAAAFTATGVVVAMTRFLQLAGVPRMPTGMGLWIFMLAIWSIAVIVLHRRYR